MHGSIIRLSLPLEVGIDHLANGCLAVWELPEFCIYLQEQLLQVNLVRARIIDRWVANLREYCQTSRLPIYRTRS